jgi:hypothetical protein
VLSDEGDVVVREELDASNVNETIGGVPIHLLYENEDSIKLVKNSDATEVPIKYIDRFLKEKQVEKDGSTYMADLPTYARARLASGLPVTVMGRRRNADSKDESRVLIRFKPEVEKLNLNEQEVNILLATGQVTIKEKSTRIHLSSHNINSLLTNNEVIVATEKEKNGFTLVHLQVIQQLNRPIDSKFRITDLSKFLASPFLPASNNSIIPVELNPGAIQRLRTEGRATFTVNGVKVEMIYDRSLQGMNYKRNIFPFYDNVVPANIRPPENIETRPNPFDPPRTGGIPNMPRIPEINRTKPWQWNPPLEGVPEPLKPGVFGGTGNGSQTPPEKPTFSQAGLQIAVLLPWRQRWILEGYSRGSLISSIALAPREETTISILSWERRAKALEQSTETDVEQQFDFTQTTRDTEDIFNEITNQHDFQAQLNGSLDASYTNGVASVNIGTNGSINNAESLTSVFRTTGSHMREVSSKASTRVRSRRITKITETIERGISQEVTRRIRNTNECRTLTLDFHEVLAHYRIETDFLPSRVRIVVLIPNPISLKGFNDLIVRKNETTLRNALLDSALADGFEACRQLAAFGYAKDELKELSRESKKITDLGKERQKPKDVSKPANPYEKQLLEVIKEIKEIAKGLRAADIEPALTAIGDHNPVTEDMRKSGQRWLFMMLCRAKLPPAFVGSLLELVGEDEPLTVDTAAAFMDSVPDLNSSHQLKNLNSVPDNEKEDSGLDLAIKSVAGISWVLTWAWWTGRCRDENLYNADDMNLTKKIERLKDLLNDYNTKAAEGEGIEVGNSLTQTAMENQEQTSYLDRLEMKYGIEVIASAKERREALIEHLNDHMDYYRYVMFQALPPGEQLRKIMEAAQQLKVGMFEPHVVAMNGDQLAIPLTPLGETKLAKTLTSLQDLLKKASEEAAQAEDAMTDNSIILPTPGISVESWLGQCSGCEEHVEELREAELRRVIAEARLVELEADRLATRLESNPPLLEDPSNRETASLQVNIKKATEV